MDYSVKLKQLECEILASLLGHPLRRVLVDGWGAEIQTKRERVSVIPQEVATPDAAHPHANVKRPSLLNVAESQLGPARRIAGEELGQIRSVSVVSILAAFTPLTRSPPREFPNGVTLPAGYGYGLVYYPPGQSSRARREAGKGAMVDLDVAIEFTSEHCPSLVLYTRGFFINVSLDGLPTDEDWVRIGKYSRRTLTR